MWAYYIITLLQRYRIKGDEAMLRRRLQLLMALFISLFMIAGAAWVMLNLRSDEAVPDRAKLIFIHLDDDTNSIADNGHF